MSAIRSEGTGPERALAEILVRLFPRRKVVHGDELPGKPDFFLPGIGLAIFVDGCFWHSCPEHGRVPRDNRAYWRPKLIRNRERDHLANRALRGDGILPLRVWEHDLRGRRARQVASRLERRLVAAAERAAAGRTR